MSVFTFVASVLAVVLQPPSPGAAPDAAGEASADGAAKLFPNDPRIDRKTGRQLANWRRPVEFDQKHMLLELDIPDMQTPRLSARERLTLAAVGEARRTVTLDAEDLAIRSVKAGGRPVEYAYDDSKVTITLPAPAAPGVDFDLVFEYDWIGPKKTAGQGLNWTEGKPGSENPTDRAGQIHTQGQPESNRRWFIASDFPNDRMTTEMVITLPAEYQAISNGRLVSHTVAGGRSTWHWLQDKPHPTYLVVMVAGVFAQVDVGGADSARPGLPMTVWTRVGDEERTKRSFASTARMVALFEKLLDEAYPWAKYDQLIVRDFKWGGMENTSASVMNYQMSMSRGAEELIAHELAHQWFGDLLTTESWEHLWLNEGWATFMEAVWAEERGGEDPQARRRAYLRAIVRGMASERMTNNSSAPEYPAMVSNRYTDPEEPFLRPNNVYSKGGLVLHMLRERLGDETFWKGVRLYIDRRKFTSVETDDFRRAMEEVSGQSLERFFDQWAYRPGLPRLAVDFGWDADASVLKVTVEQTQTIDVYNPAYALHLPLVVKFADESTRTVYLETDEKVRTQSFTLAGKGWPTGVTIDPSLTNIARVSTRTALPKPPAAPEPAAPSEAPTNPPAGSN